MRQVCMVPLVVCLALCGCRIGPNDSSGGALDGGKTGMMCGGSCAGCLPVDCACKDGTVQSGCVCDSTGRCADSSFCPALHACDSHGGPIPVAADAGPSPHDAGPSPHDAGPTSQDAGASCTPYMSTLQLGCTDPKDPCLVGIGPHAMNLSDPVFCTTRCNPTATLPCPGVYACPPGVEACVLTCDSDSFCTGFGFGSCYVNSVSNYCVP